MPNSDKKTKVCYVLSYRCPDIVRTRTLLEALRKIDDVELFRAINTSLGFFRYFQTVYSLLVIRFRFNPDIFLLGFRGYELFPLVRLITLGKTLVFDHMMSPYDSLVNERRSIKKGGILDRLVYEYERLILHMSDVVLTDTIIHKNFFVDNFGICPEKIHEIHVGTDEEIFRPCIPSLPDMAKEYFAVLFYGSFLPLHGIDIILGAAGLLKDNPIQFILIGGGEQKLDSFYSSLKNMDLKNVQHKIWVPFDTLPELICHADICLGGPFGNTGQGKRVITTKTFQSLAMAKATIIGEIDYDYGFICK